MQVCKRDISDFIWPFLPPYMGDIPNPKMAFIFPISCIFALVFPLFMKHFPKCEGKGSFPKSKIKSLDIYLEKVLQLGASNLDDEKIIW